MTIIRCFVSILIASIGYVLLGPALLLSWVAERLSILAQAILNQK